MKRYFYLIMILILCGCKSSDGIEYSVYSKQKLVFKILPNDIVEYDTSLYRNSVGIHKLLLRDNFFSEDSILLHYPLELICFIDGKKYFWANHFFPNQSVPRYHVNFYFNPNCENKWKSNELLSQFGDSLILYTKNECNSIEFFHQKDEIIKHFDYYLNKESFIDYTDTARLAHEILFDPYYINALKESGVKIK